MMLGVQSITENKNVPAESLPLDLRHSWPTAKGLVLVGAPGAFHRLPSLLLLSLLRTLFSSYCLFVAGAGSSLDGFIATETLSTSLSIFYTLAGAILGSKKYKLFTFALLTDTFGVGSVLFHIFTHGICLLKLTSKLHSAFAR